MSSANISRSPFSHVFSTRSRNIRAAQVIQSMCVSWDQALSHNHIMQVKIIILLTIALDAVADEADVARAEVPANLSIEFLTLSNWRALSLVRHFLMNC